MRDPTDIAKSLQSRRWIIDGALATELERRGHDTSGPLWSGDVLLASPDAIAGLHYDYLRAGADILITASYQLTPQGMADIGFSESEAVDALRLSVDLALRARERYRADTGDKRDILVAASIGPFGAYLADGSEYHGDYGKTEFELIDFHRRRFEILSETGADLIAFETIPSLLEARALAFLLRERPTVPAWISFACRDNARTCHGEPIADCAAALESTANLVAVGVNCTAPRHVTGLVKALRGASRKAVAAYPNSGEDWDAEGHCFTGESAAAELPKLAKEWIAAGATLIGGCCRTGPDDIARLRYSRPDGGMSGT